MTKARDKPRPRTVAPAYFYAIGYRLAQVYGLTEQPRVQRRPTMLAWFAKYKTREQIEVFADSIVIRIEDGTSHTLVIDDAVDVPTDDEEV